jgi:hypothetical protein
MLVSMYESLLPKCDGGNTPLLLKGSTTPAFLDVQFEGAANRLLQ